MGFNFQEQLRRATGNRWGKPSLAEQIAAKTKFEQDRLSKRPPYTNQYRGDETYKGFQIQQPTTNKADEWAAVAGLVGALGPQTTTRTSSRSSGPFRWSSPDFNQYLQAQLAGIGQAYAKAEGVLGEQRGRAEGVINSSYGDAMGAFQRSNADFNRQAELVNASTGENLNAARMEALGQASGLANDLNAQFGGGEGTAQASKLAQDVGATLAAQSSLEANLGKRMQEVTNQQYADTQQSAAQVKQAGHGELANNYSAILGEIQANRAKEEAAVQQQVAQMRMQDEQARNAAYNQYLQSQGSETVTETGPGMNPIDLQMAALELQKMRQDVEGKKPIDFSGAPALAQQFLYGAEGDPMGALSALTSFATQQQDAERYYNANKGEMKDYKPSIEGYTFNPDQRVYQNEYDMAKRWLQQYLNQYMQSQR